MLFLMCRLRIFTALMSTFAILLTVGFSSSLRAESVPREAQVYDKTDSYSFGALTVIPIDSQYINPPICIFLDSCGADSVVRVFPDANPDDTMFTRPSGKTVKLADLSKIYRVYFSVDVVWPDFETAYRDRDSLSVVTPEYTYEPQQVVPNDPVYGAQWHLHNHAMGIADGKTNIESAWETTKGNATQIIGMVDTGIDGDNPEFAGRIVGTAHFGPGSTNPNTDSEPDGGHGTSVAGLMIANTNNSLDIAGVNWNAGIYVANLDDNSSVAGKFKFESSAIGQGVNGAVGAGAQYINLSLGSQGFGEIGTTSANFNAWVQGVSVVAAKGNDTSSLFFSPSDWNWVIGVGASDGNDFKADFSNTGNGIRVAAPGVFIRTTVDGGGITTNFGGTSAAAPIATGVLSLIRAANPNLWADEAEEILNLTARDVGTPGYDVEFGWGIVDAKAAVEYAISHDFHRLGGPHTSLTEVQGNHQRTILVSPAGNLATGTYFAKRYAARRWIDYSQFNLTELPDVLIRFRDVEGWSAENPNQKSNWATVVPGTQTTQGVLVETFGYRLINSVGQFAGWWLCPTGDCGSAPVTDLQVTIAMPPVSCCIIRGDVNHDSIGPDIDDLNFLIDHLFINFPPIPCMEEGNIDNDPNGVVDVADLSLLLDHLFINFPPLDVCD